jgi:hypothetical protein
VDFETATSFSERYTALQNEAEAHEPKTANLEQLSLVDHFKSLADRIAALPREKEEEDFITHETLFGDTRMHHLTIHLALAEDYTASGITAWWDSAADFTVTEYVTLDEILGVESTLDSEPQEDIQNTAANDIARRLGLLEESIRSAENYAEVKRELSESVAAGEVFMNYDELMTYHGRLSADDIIRIALEAEPEPVAGGQATRVTYMRDGRGAMRRVEFKGYITEED